MRTKCVERYCELANKKTEQLYTVSTPCLDDHNFKKEELETVGELSDVCSQVVLKCLYLARVGRLDILWSVNKLARSVTKWTRACDRRLARLISNFITRMIIDSIVMWVIQLNTADWVYSKTQILLVTLKIRNKHQEDSSVSLEVEHLFPLVGCAKKQTSVCHRSAESETISLDAGLRMDGILALDLWCVVIEVSHSSSNVPPTQKDLYNPNANQKEPRQTAGTKSITPC